MKKRTLGLLVAALSSILGGCQMVTLDPPYRTDSYAFNSDMQVTAQTLPSTAPFFNLSGPTIPETLPAAAQQTPATVISTQASEQQPVIIATQPQTQPISSQAVGSAETTVPTDSWLAVESTAASVQETTPAATTPSLDFTVSASQGVSLEGSAPDPDSCSHIFLVKSIPATCSAGGYELEVCTNCGLMTYTKTAATREHQWQEINGIVSCLVCGKTVDEHHGAEEEYAEGDAFSGDEEYAEGDALAQPGSLTAFAYGTPAPYNGISYTESGTAVHLVNSMDTEDMQLSDSDCLYVSCELFDWNGNASADIEAFLLPAFSDSAQLSATYRLYDGTGSSGGLYLFWKRDGSLFGYRLFYADYGGEVLQPDGGQIEDEEQIRSILLWFGIEEDRVPNNQRLQ